MQLTTLASIAISVAACGGAPPPAAPAAAAPTQPDRHAAAVADLVGVWQGRALGTPTGDFPFAIAFDREPDGAVHGRINGAPGMYFDFRFHRDGARWLLTEAGAIPGVGEQTHTLAPVAGTPPRWVADPEVDLVVELAVDADTMMMTTTLRGQPHAVFRMARARGPAAEQIRQAIARGPRPQ